jgi:hypothetical protein
MVIWIEIELDLEMQSRDADDAILHKAMSELQHEASHEYCLPQLQTWVLVKQSRLHWQVRGLTHRRV